MNYIELYIPTPNSAQSEIYMAQLSDFPFESFEQEEFFVKAYIKENLLDECKKEVDEFLYTTGVQWKFTPIETVNWNSQWESNFQPVEIEDLCVIRAPFHEASSNGAMDIVIMPKMSFGTGHHATTFLMTKSILGHDFSALKGLDMGSGTGVLSIIAAKLGATSIDAVDIDEWAAENCKENIVMNSVEEVIVPILGDVSAIDGSTYDFILANINRNILLNDMDKYVTTLKSGGFIIMSGILEHDIESICNCAEKLGLKRAKTHLKDGWAALEFNK